MSNERTIIAPTIAQSHRKLGELDCLRACPTLEKVKNPKLKTKDILHAAMTFLKGVYLATCCFSLELFHR